MNGRRIWRERWIGFHRWIGIVAGAVLVLVGLTGSLYVFVREIRLALDPSTQWVHVGERGRAGYLGWSEILATAELKKPAGTILSGIGGPLTEEESARVFYSPQDAGTHSSDFHELCFDPYTGAYLGESRLEDRWVWKICDFLFRLHYSLALDDLGGRVVGIAAIIGLGSIVSGLYLWWPGFGRLRTAFVVHRNGAGVRRQYDVHRVLGFYFSLSLGVLLLSGVWMNFNAQFVGLVKWLSPGTQAGEPEARGRVGEATRLTYDPSAILARIRAQFPEGHLNWASIPKDSLEPMVISFVEVPGSGIPHWSERTIYVDAASGEVLRVDDPARRRSWGESFLAWQWPLHSGRAFGWPGRMLVFLTGFVPLALYVTGLKVWWHKRRSKARHKGEATLAA